MRCQPCSIPFSVANSLMQADIVIMQACIGSAKSAKDCSRGDKITPTHAREQLMSAVATATAALACTNIDNIPGLAKKSRARVKDALALLADDTNGDQVKRAWKNMEQYCVEKEKGMTPAS